MLLLHTTWQDFLISIAASIIASTIFIFMLLFLMRPKIKIAPYICKRRDKFDDVEETYFGFKIVNLSWFSAYDVTVELSSLVSYPMKNGMNFRYTPLKLKTSKSNFLAPYRPSLIKKNYADYALIFRTYEDLESILSHNLKSIQLEVTLKHGVTGLSRIHVMNFADCSEIKVGNFEYGNNFNIA